MHEGRALSKIKAFLRLSRIPFLTPGLAPFTAGILLGTWLGGRAEPGLVVLGYSGLTLIMLATHYSKQVFLTTKATF